MTAGGGFMASSAPLRRLLASSLLVLFFAGLNGLTGLYQGYAFARMLQTNLEQGYGMDALARTFDPAHPCARCLKVQAAKTLSEYKSASTAPVASGDWWTGRPFADWRKDGVTAAAPEPSRPQGARRSSPLWRPPVG